MNLTCPKPFTSYPDTSTRVERPFGVFVRKVDPTFDKDRRFDRAYEFGRRVFKEDALSHGAYVPMSFGFSSGFSAGFNTRESELRVQNGLCGAQ